MGAKNSTVTAFAAGAATASLAWALAGRRGAARGSATPRAAGSHERFVGVDLGATTVAVALVDDSGSVLRRTTSNIQDRSFEAVSQLIIANVLHVLKDAGCSVEDVSAIGIGAPGNLDCDRGTVISAANFDWKDMPLTEAVRNATGLPTFLENDANAAVLAEWWAGAGAGDGIKHMAMFTLGTGIGGGIISDGRLLRGATGMAGEFGHTIVEPCVGSPEAGRLCAGTGVRGILEQYCSARAVAARAAEALAAGAASSLGPGASAKDVFEHAAAGDALARRLVEETADYLAVGFVNACRSVEPQLIVVSGGLALAGEALLAPVTRHFQRRWWTIQPLSTCRIVLATAGNDAGVVGAAAAARLRLEKSV